MRFGRPNLIQVNRDKQRKKDNFIYGSVSILAVLFCLSPLAYFSYQYYQLDTPQPLSTRLEKEREEKPGYFRKLNGVNKTLCETMCRQDSQCEAVIHQNKSCEMYSDKEIQKLSAQNLIIYRGTRHECIEHQSESFTVFKNCNINGKILTAFETSDLLQCRNKCDQDKLCVGWQSKPSQCKLFAHIDHIYGFHGVAGVKH